MFLHSLVVAWQKSPIICKRKVGDLGITHTIGYTVNLSIHICFPQ